MSKNFLDYTGLTKYTEKIEAFISGKLFNFVPKARTINAKQLSSDITLKLSDIGEAGDGVTIDGKVLNVTNSNRGIVSRGDFAALSKEEQNKGTYFISGSDSDVHIYGVEWDGTATTKWTRTDDAALFEDPIPAVSNGTGSSPFDNLYPWCNMTVEERTGGTMVKEPKYWFKWTKTGKTMKLQIADGPVEGFYVDPVNMDRGDGLGELDFSYIGRYHCASDTWKSETNKAQKVNITRAQARAGIHSLGANFWQMDFAQFWYINMLYLVEFADWNGQTTIGYGCSINGSKENNGKTDAMQYHTGTTAASQTAYGHVQYRNIEGWWDNVFNWMDGCYYNSNGLNVILNPNDFSDTDNGTLIGSMPSDGFPISMAVPTQSEFAWALRPKSTGGSNSTYVPDYWYFSASSPCLFHGADCDKGQYRGPFYIVCNGVTNTESGIGCRLQERPPKVS